MDSMQTRHRVLGDAFPTTGGSNERENRTPGMFPGFGALVHCIHTVLVNRRLMVEGRRMSSAVSLRA